MGIFGHVQHPAGLALGVGNCSFNSGSLAPDPAQLGFGSVSLEGMHTFEVMHVLLREWHVTFPTTKISIDSQQLTSENSLSWALGLS